MHLLLRLSFSRMQNMAARLPPPLLRSDSVVFGNCLGCAGAGGLGCVEGHHCRPSLIPSLLQLSWMYFATWNAADLHRASAMQAGAHNSEQTSLREKFAILKLRTGDATASSNWRDCKCSGAGDNVISSHEVYEVGHRRPSREVYEVAALLPGPIQPLLTGLPPALVLGGSWADLASNSREFALLHARPDSPLARARSRPLAQAPSSSGSTLARWWKFVCVHPFEIVEACHTSEIDRVGVGGGRNPYQRHSSIFSQDQPLCAACFLCSLWGKKKGLKERGTKMLSLQRFIINNKNTKWFEMV